MDVKIIYIETILNLITCFFSIHLGIKLTKCNLVSNAILFFTGNCV